MLKLWRKAFYKAFAANMIINLQLYVHTKITYFGRQMLNNNKSLIEYKQKRKVLPFILEPDSKFKILWNLNIIFLLLYTAVVTPYRTSFSDDLEQVDFFYVMELLIDINFGIDIFINFISAYET